MLTLMGGFPWTLMAYVAVGLMAKAKPAGFYEDREEQKFWQGVRANPARSTRNVHASFRELDRRLADIETYYTSRNRRLEEEINALR
jgi:phage shock protein C